MKRVVPLGTSATCVQSPHVGDSMSFSARSASPTASLVAAAELPGEDEAEGAGVALDAVTPSVRTDAFTMRNVPPFAGARPIGAAAVVDTGDVVAGGGVGVALASALGAGVGVGLVAADGVADAAGVDAAGVDAAGDDAAGDDAAGADALALGDGVAAIRALPVLPTA